MRTKTIDRLILLFLTTIICGSTPVAAGETTAREESAKAIIQSMRTYQSAAETLIAQIKATTQEAKSLSGQAHKYQSTVIPKMKPLTGAKLAAARKMYQSDLDQFADHAKAYKQHTQSVHTQFGQCEASKRAYEQNRQQYSLHMKQFHMEDIPPPHICLDLNAAADDSNMTAGKLRGTVKRMMEAQLNLMKAERDYRVARRNSPLIDAQTRKQNDLNLQEQSLAQEFGQLEEEYRQLQVEHKALNPGAKTRVSTVHGKVKQH
jgi:hypothetical protein